MQIKRKITSMLLAILMLLTSVISGGVGVSAETSGNQLAQQTVRGGAILHCFDWSYNSIKANLASIAAAGYTAVQTSPVQQPKDYSPDYTDQSTQWWKLYQPLGLSVADGGNWLGTKAELRSLCEAADEYGIKVIVDIVANHMANKGADGGGFDNVNTEIESDLYNPDYFHSENTRSDDTNRYTITQYHIRMPDLNTADSYVQSRVLSLLKECVDLGVDGFRFDSAKHIELPTDTEDNCASDFWPNVIGGINEYANGDLFHYGDILNFAGTEISNYTPYIDITDNYSSDYALYAANSLNSGALAVNTYVKGAAPSESVLWVESHNTYMDNYGSAGIYNTADISDDVIVKAWAIIGSRADSTSLFFARPAEKMGDASTDTTWNSKEVSEVNKFKNYFDGTTEYLGYSNEYTTTYNERGTEGVVISKLDGGGYVKLNANKIADGAYRDQISGGVFIVAGGYITGTVGSGGVAVVYNPNGVGPVIDNSSLYLSPNSNWTIDGARFAMYVFNRFTDAKAWIDMTDPDGDGIYSAAIPEGDWDDVIFCRMNGETTENNWNNVWNQTSDLPIPELYNWYTVSPGVWSFGDGTWSIITLPDAEDEYTIGDISDDGEIDSIDAALALKYDSGIITLDETQLKAGDVNGDGEVDSIDATIILKYDAGLIASF